VNTRQKHLGNAYEGLPNWWRSCGLIWY